MNVSKYIRQRWLLLANVITCLPLEITRDIAFCPINFKVRAKKPDMKKACLITKMTLSTMLWITTCQAQFKHH